MFKRLWLAVSTAPNDCKTIFDCCYPGRKWHPNNSYSRALIPIEAQMDLHEGSMTKFEGLGGGGIEVSDLWTGEIPV